MTAIAMFEVDTSSTGGISMTMMADAVFQMEPDVDPKFCLVYVELLIKVEVNFVMRGTVQPVRRASLTATARDALMADLDIPVVSLEDMYGGKLVAALDRQHPRDLFDVMLLFAHEGITPGIRRAFVVYLASSNRPVHEVLFPPLRNVQHDYEHNFQGMTAEPVSLDALLATRERMVRELQQGLDDDERSFLLSLVAGAPDWSLLNIAHLEHLPGIRWKLHNLAHLQKSNAKKFAEQGDLLAAKLPVGTSLARPRGEG